MCVCVHACANVMHACVYVYLCERNTRAPGLLEDGLFQVKKRRLPGFCPAILEAEVILVGKKTGELHPLGHFTETGRAKDLFPPTALLGTSESSTQEPQEGLDRAHGSQQLVSSQQQ